MAPTQKDSKSAKSSRNTRSSVNSGQDAGEEHDVGSQGGESLDLLEMAEKMIQSTQKRRENRRRKIRLDYANAMTTLEDDINSAFDERAKLILKAYKAKAQSLDAVLKRRTAILNKMSASIERLNTAYNQANNEFHLTVAGRLRAVEKQDGTNAAASQIMPG